MADPNSDLLNKLAQEEFMKAQREYQSPQNAPLRQANEAAVRNPPSLDTAENRAAQKAAEAEMNDPKQAAARDAAYRDAMSALRKTQYGSAKKTKKK